VVAVCHPRGCIPGRWTAAGLPLVDLVTVRGQHEQEKTICTWCRWSGVFGLMMPTARIGLDALLGMGVYVDRAGPGLAFAFDGGLCRGAAPLATDPFFARCRTLLPAFH
jgi:hypothetical protein